MSLTLAALLPTMIATAVVVGYKFIKDCCLPQRKAPMAKRNK